MYGQSPTKSKLRKQMEDRRLDFYGSKEFNREAEGKEEVRNQLNCEHLSKEIAGQFEEVCGQWGDGIASHLETHPYHPETLTTITKARLYGGEVVFLSVYNEQEVEDCPSPIYMN